MLILGLRLGALGDHFDVFLRLWGQTLDPFLTFLEKAREKCKKEQKKGAEFNAFSMKFQVFSRKWESAFRLRRRERIEVQAPDFLVLCLNFCFL